MLSMSFSHRAKLSARYCLFQCYLEPDNCTLSNFAKLEIIGWWAGGVCGGFSIKHIKIILYSEFNDNLYFLSSP